MRCGGTGKIQKYGGVGSERVSIVRFWNFSVKQSIVAGLLDIFRLRRLVRHHLFGFLQEIALHEIHAA